MVFVAGAAFIAASTMGVAAGATSLTGAAAASTVGVVAGAASVTGAATSAAAMPLRVLSLTLSRVPL